MSICHSFSLVTSTKGKFILILISSSWISVACVRWCDWDKLWLLVILLRILLIMVPWCRFSFHTCFIIVFFSFKSSLMVIISSIQNESIRTFCPLGHILGLKVLGDFKLKKKSDKKKLTKFKKFLNYIKLSCAELF